MLVFKATVEYKLLSIGAGYETAKLLLEKNYGNHHCGHCKEIKSRPGYHLSQVIHQIIRYSITS